MLFSYIPPTSASNWFHDCMAETIKAVHRITDAGVVRFPKWPTIAPSAHHAKLQRKSSLENGFKAYFTALKKVKDKTERGRILTAFENQNKIAELLAHTAACDPITDLPTVIRAPARKLFKSAFELLDDLDVRHAHYEATCQPFKHGACPFCGYETINDSNSPLDHYLAESIYPFAGVNLNNLPFMGHECNSKCKLKANMLWKGTAERHSFNPFAAQILTLSLDRSVPFAGDDGELPQWEIDFTPASEQLNTWLEVFKIKDRYKRHLLDKYFKTWIGEFLDWAKLKPVPFATPDELIAALNEYVLYCDTIGLNDRFYFRAAAFRMLHLHCKNGNQRLIKLITDTAPSTQQVAPANASPAPSTASAATPA